MCFEVVSTPATQGARGCFDFFAAYVYHGGGAIKPYPPLDFLYGEKAQSKKGFAERNPAKRMTPLCVCAVPRKSGLDHFRHQRHPHFYSVLHGKTLNVGRVQTPTLKTLADRDAAITSFKKETYHIVRLDVGGAEAASAGISDAAAMRKSSKRLAKRHDHFAFR